MTHRIRLRGPWELEPLAGSEPLPPAGQYTMPASWADFGYPHFTGTTRHRRRFGLPTSLTANESVWLIFPAMSGRAEAWLNGQLLLRFGPAPAEVEIGHLLLSRNELVIILNCPEPGGGLTGEVALEIRQR